MLHIELQEQIEGHFGAAQVTLCRDALDVRLANGVELTLRFASPDEFAMSWRWGEAVMSIDMAPLHDALRTFPNHLHTPDGLAVDDPVCEIGATPWHNVRALIERLMVAPMLGYEVSCVDDVGAVSAADAGNF